MQLDGFWRGLQILCFWGAALSIAVLFGPELLQLILEAVEIRPFSPGPGFKFPEPDSPVWNRADRIASYTLGATVLFGIIATIFGYKADRRGQRNGPGGGAASDGKALNGTEGMAGRIDEAEKAPGKASDAEDDSRGPEA